MKETILGIKRFGTWLADKIEAAGGVLYTTNRALIKECKQHFKVKLSDEAIRGYLRRMHNYGYITKSYANNDDVKGSTQLEITLEMRPD